MGKRKAADRAADEAALTELERVIDDLVDAALRRTTSIVERRPAGPAHHDLHHAVARLRSWRRPGREVRAPRSVAVRDQAADRRRRAAA